MNDPSVATPLTIIAFGDSITQAIEVEPALRWPALVEVSLAGQFPQRTITVINAGIGGNTSREGLARIEGVVGNSPDIVLAEFGGNDATHEVERYVDLDEFVANLAAIEKCVTTAGARLVLVTFPPIIDSQTSSANEPTHTQYGGPDGHVELYRAKTREYAEGHGLDLIDIDFALRQAIALDGWQPYFQTDGVHLTEAGNRVVERCVSAGLLASL